MRLEEILALEWKDIDFKKNTINISKSISKSTDGKQIISTTKSGKTRIIIMDQSTMDTIKKLKQFNKKYVFERNDKMVSSSYPLKKLNSIIRKNKIVQVMRVMELFEIFLLPVRLPHLFSSFQIIILQGEQQ